MAVTEINGEDSAWYNRLFLEMQMEIEVVFSLQTIWVINMIWLALNGLHQLLAKTCVVTSIQTQMTSQPTALGIPEYSKVSINLDVIHVVVVFSCSSIWHFHLVDSAGIFKRHHACQLLTGKDSWSYKIYEVTDVLNDVSQFECAVFQNM